MDDQSRINERIQRSDLPAVAIAICTRDRNDSLLKTLESIWRQTYLPRELIVIDDGRMPDETWEQIAFDCQNAGVAWIYDRSDGTGLTTSRNRAARIASSEIIQYLDDDVTCDAAFLERVAELFIDQNVDGVTAAVSEPSLEGPAAQRFARICRVARWWAIRPRRLPTAPRPDVLSRPDVAIPARWMSGCAMAFRRAVIISNPFDERLRAYALGEDREMGYRLMPRHWLIESRLARVTHRRDASGRADPRRFGYMTAYNYLYILNRTCGLRNLRRFEPYYSLAVMALRHVPGALRRGGRARRQELLGMARGVAAWMTSRPESSAIAPRAERLPRAAIGASPVRVAFIANRLEAGGAERLLVSLAKALPSHGVTPVIVCFKEAGSLAGECREAGLSVHDYLLKFKHDVAVIVRLQRLLERERVDAIFVSQSGGDRMFWSTLCAQRMRLPVVVWSHWFPRRGARHLERVNRALIRGVDRFVALAESHRETLAAVEGIPRSKTLVIPNGIDPAAFASADRRAGRTALCLMDDEYAVGIVANLRREKRHDVFLDAAARLSKLHPNMRFLIVGDGPMRDLIQRQIRARRLDSVRMTGPRSDVAQVLAALDVCCLCSETECFSVTMLEAAAAECPFIGPAAGAMGEFLKHEETGIAIRPADAASLADAVSRLHAAPELAERLAANAAALVAERYSLAQMAGAFTALFRDVALPRPHIGQEQATRELAMTLQYACTSVRELDCRVVV